MFSFPVPDVSTRDWTDEDWQTWITTKGKPTVRNHGGIGCDCPTCCTVRAILFAGSMDGRFSDEAFHRAVKEMTV